MQSGLPSAATSLRPPFFVRGARSRFTDVQRHTLLPERLWNLAGYDVRDHSGAHDPVTSSDIRPTGTRNQATQQKYSTCVTAGRTRLGHFRPSLMRWGEGAGEGSAIEPPPAPAEGALTPEKAVATLAALQPERDRCG